jgi:chromate transporter
MSDSAAVAPAPIPQVPTHADLFFAFCRISISAFGGALPWTRRMFVEKKRWMTADEFNDAYAVCQFLPGPNIVNLASVFGSRVRGASGALAAWAGFLTLPFLLMTCIAILYSYYGDALVLRRILGAIAAAAAGIMIATFMKMVETFFRGRLGPAPFIALATLAAIGLFRLPMLWVMIALVPLSIVLAWWVRR